MEFFQFFYVWKNPYSTFVFESNFHGMNIMLIIDFFPLFCLSTFKDVPLSFSGLHF